MAMPRSGRGTSRPRTCTTGTWDEAERFNEQARRLTPANSGRTLFSTLHAADIAAGRGNDDAAIRLFQQILKEPEAEAALQWAAHDGLATIARRSGNAARSRRSSMTPLSGRSSKPAPD